MFVYCVLRDINCFSEIMVIQWSRAGNGWRVDFGHGRAKTRHSKYNEFKLLHCNMSKKSVESRELSIEKKKAQHSHSHSHSFPPNGLDIGEMLSANVCVVQPSSCFLSSSSTLSRSLCLSLITRIWVRDWQCRGWKIQTFLSYLN